MEFIEFCRQRERMCITNSRDNNDVYIDCKKECPLKQFRDSKNSFCKAACIGYPEEAESVVQQWVQEHPEEPHVPTENKPKTYEQGLEDAWELAIKIWCHIDTVELYKIFGTDEAYEVMNGFTVQEAMQKLQEWEDNNSFKAGDIVEFKNDGTKAVVIDSESEETVIIFTENGCAESDIFKTAIKKTGRNISDQLNALLEAVKGE